MAQGNYALAIQNYLELTRQNDHSPALFFELGVAQYQTGDFASSVRSLRMAAEFKEHPIGVEAFLGLSQAATGHATDAIAALRVAFAAGDKLDPELYAIVGKRLGHLYWTSGQKGEAETVFSHLLVKYPHDPEVLYESFWFRLSGAQDLMKRLVEDAPDSYRTHEMLGYLLMQKQNYGAATEEFRKALGQNPEAVGLHYELGNLLLMSNYSDQNTAAKEFQQELALHPGHAPSYFRLGELAVRNRDRAQATRFYELTLKNDPHYASALVGLAKISLENGNAQEALGYAKRSVETDTTNRSAHYLLSRVYGSLGRKAEAEKEIAEFQRLDKQAAATSSILMMGDTGTSEHP